MKILLFRRGFYINWKALIETSSIWSKKKIKLKFKIANNLLKTFYLYTRKNRTRKSAPKISKNLNLNRLQNISQNRSRTQPQNRSQNLRNLKNLIVQGAKRKILLVNIANSVAQSSRMSMKNRLVWYTDDMLFVPYLKIKLKVVWIAAGAICLKILRQGLFFH